MFTTPCICPKSVTLEAFPLLEGEVSEHFRQNLIMKPIAVKFTSINTANKPIPRQSGWLDAGKLQICSRYMFHFTVTISQCLLQSHKWHERHDTPDLYISQSVLFAVTGCRPALAQEVKRSSTNWKVSGSIPDLWTQCVQVSLGDILNLALLLAA